MNVGGMLSALEDLQSGLQDGPTAFNYRVFSPPEPLKVWQTTRCVELL